MNIACCVRNNVVLEQIRLVLRSAGFACEVFASDTALLRSANRQSFDLILFDLAVDLREGDGIFSWLTCRSGDHTPVLILSPMRDADTVAFALNSGADDFVVRPFEPVELVARIHALLRRSHRHTARRAIELSGFTLNRESNIASYRDTPILLTPREFSMAWLFFSSPGVYISRETIGRSIWSADSEIAGRTIEQHVYKLRKKLELGPARGVVIRTAYTQGYRLQVI